MPYDQVLLPLLGGYFFIRRFHLTAYRFAGFSGYRLIMSSAIVGVVLALTASGSIHLVRLSEDPVILHTVLIAPACVGLLMLIYGSWKVVRRLRTEGPSFDTDSSGEFEVRERNRRLRRLVAALLFIASSISIVWLGGHAFASGPFEYMPLATGAMIVMLLLSVQFIFYVKRRSQLHGYEVSFRLGLILVAGCAIFLTGYHAKEAIEGVWALLVPFDYAGTAMLAMGLGVVSVLPANILFPYDAAISWLDENKRLDGLESLFYYSSITFQQVIISLRDNKFYVGYVDGEIPIAGRTDEYVAIVPTASGYRHKSSRELVFTTFYLEPFQKAIEQDGADLIPGDLAKVIPLSEIVSAGIFDAELYKHFQDEATD